MQCHVCGTEVRPEHKFCMECGARLQRSPAELALAPPFALEESNRLPAPTSHPMFDPATGQLLAVPPPPRLPPSDEDATNVLPAVGAPLGRGGFGPPDLSARGPGRWDHPPEPTSQWPDESYVSDQRPAPTVQPPYRNEYEGGYHDATGRVPATYAPWEAAAWEQDETASAAATFRLKPLLVLAVVTAAAAIVGMFLAILDLDVPGNPELDGPWKLNDLGTNLTVAGMLTVLTMVLGALAWCVGFRWGAGLAGGAGAALAGWAALAVGQAEAFGRSGASPLVADSAVTRGAGFWAVAGAGILGLVVLVVSLARTGDDGRAGLDPWVAALGAMATITAVVGPLIPLDDADVDLNWSSAPGTDVPTVWFAARFVQLGLLLLCGVFGFLLVRRYGLGLAIGGTICAGWLVLTAATEQTEFPVGLAVGNPGGLVLSPYAIVPSDEPHIVTIVGVGLIIFFGLVATAMALIDDR